MSLHHFFTALMFFSISTSSLSKESSLMGYLSKLHYKPRQSFGIRSGIQQSFSTAVAATLGSATIKRYTDTACATLTTSTSLTGGGGGVSVSTGTYSSSAASLHSLCEAYNNANTFNAQCTGLRTDLLADTVNSMDFTYTYQNGLVTKSSCMYNPDQTYEGELNYPAATTCSSSACGVSRSYSAFALPVLYSATVSGLAYANNTAVTGSLAEQMPDGSNLVSIAAYGTKAYASSAGGNVYVSASTGTSRWALVGAGSPDGSLPITAMAVNTSNGDLYVAGTTTGSVYVSINGTGNWSQVASAEVETGQINSAIAIDSSGNVYAANINKKVFSSASGGGVWTLVSTQNNALGEAIQSISVYSNTTVYVGDSAGKVYRSVSGGSWTVAGGTYVEGENLPVTATAIDSNHKLYASANGATNSVYVSTSGTGAWSQVGGGGSPDSSTVRSIAINSSNDVYAATLAGNVYVSTSGTGAWSQVGGGAASTDSISSVFSVSTLIYVGTGNNDVKLSTSGGAWSAVAAFGGGHINASVVNGSKFYVGNSNGEVYLSTSGGVFSLVGGGSPDGSFITSLALSADATKLYAGTFNGSVYLSTSGGSWGQVGGGATDLGITVASLTINSDGTELYAGTGAAHVKLSTSGGNWTQVGGDLGEGIVSLAINGTSLYAGGNLGTVFSGSTLATTTSLGSASVNSIVISSDGSKVYAAISNLVKLSTSGGSYANVANGAVPNGETVTSIGIDANANVYAGAAKVLYFSNAGTGDWTSTGYGDATSNISSIAVRQ